MAARTGTAHVVTTKRTYKGKVYRTHLLRRSYREDGKVKNETLGNLSHLPEHVVEMVRAALQGQAFVPVSQAFEICASRAHGHVQAVQIAMQRLGLASLIAGKASRERDLVVAMIAARVLQPHSKLATTRAWHQSTLAEEFDVADASEDDLYRAMDWLLERQGVIQNKLAARHLSEGAIALYDLSSSYFEGATCPLARLGHSRDRKRGTLQVNYGVLTNAQGCPVSISVYEGNTNDSQTVIPVMRQLRQDFGLQRVVLVGDRGMIGNAAIEAMRKEQGLQWITALKNVSIRKLAQVGDLQFGLFDERNLLEIRSELYPDERLVVCRNHALAKLRAHKRESLLAATEVKLQAIGDRVRAGRLRDQDKIGVAVGKIVNQYKVAKHFTLQIDEQAFLFARNPQSIAQEAALDGFYVIRTSVPDQAMEAAQCVRSYKGLANVERAFRSMKSIDLQVRPIHHRLENRVRAHLFVCMLAYYVQWHLQQAWRELLFADEDQAAKAVRDPVAPAKRSDKALRKVSSKRSDDGTPVHSFKTLLNELATIVRNICRTPGADATTPAFNVVTTANPTQQRALDLVRAITV